MAADFFLGESLVGEGNEVAHVDLLIGSKSGPAGAAFVSALSNNVNEFDHGNRSGRIGCLAYNIGDCLWARLGGITSR